MKAASLWLCYPVVSTPGYRICMNIILILTDIFYLSMTDSLSVIVNLSNTESLLVTVNLSNTDSLSVIVNLSNTVTEDLPIRCTLLWPCNSAVPAQLLCLVHKYAIVDIALALQLCRANSATVLSAQICYCGHCSGPATLLYQL